MKDLGIDINTVLLVVNSAFIAFASVMTWLAKRDALSTRTAAEATHVIAAATAVEVDIVKKEMNGMKTELMEKTGEASFAAGKNEARIEGEQKAAVLAEGFLEGTKTK